MRTNVTKPPNRSAFERFHRSDIRRRHCESRCSGLCYQLPPDLSAVSPRIDAKFSMLQNESSRMPRVPSLEGAAMQRFLRYWRVSPMIWSGPSQQFLRGTLAISGESSVTWNSIEIVSGMAGCISRRGALSGPLPLGPTYGMERPLHPSERDRCRPVRPADCEFTR